MKDTVAEFETYLSIAQNKAANGDQGSDLAQGMDKLTMDDGHEEDEEEDEDEEEAEYGVDDFTVVGESLTLIKFSLDALKAGLAIMTAVGDSYAALASEEPSSAEEPSSVFTSPSLTTVPSSSVTASSAAGDVDGVNATGSRLGGW